MAQVYLVGAGPGDPGLLTLKGKEILSKADVVVYDYLANETFLQFCPAGAELIYAGKKGGEHTLTQDNINQILVEKAGQGLLVVRLKGGDPYLFGRGGEEAEELSQAGVDFEVIPGVTSALAASAYAGIPLTHRKFSSSVCMITGHEDVQKTKSSLDWQALSASASTLVFFMGVKNLGHITQSLMQAGMDPGMPAALIRWGTTCKQRTLVSRLDGIQDKASQKGFSPPALLIIGEVVKLKDKLDWFEKRPLLGKGIVVTRARHQASELKGMLEEKGACCYQFPTIQVEPLDDYSEVKRTIGKLDRFEWLIFTSVNGVKFFWQQLAAFRLDARALSSCKVAAIGPATAKSLEDKGIYPDFVPKQYVAEAIIEGLLEKGVKGRKVLIPRAEKARDILPKELSEAGALVTVLPVYRTELAEQSPNIILKPMQEERIDFITFTSSSTVENFFQIVSPSELQTHVPDKIQLACIGPVTAKTLEKYGFQADILASKYTIPSLVQAIENQIINNP